MATIFSGERSRSTRREASPTPPAYSATASVPADQDFLRFPPPFRNSKSALENFNFVHQAVEDLTDSGCVYEVPLPLI